MRESIRRCLSVLMVCAVVGAGSFAMVNLDQGPEPVQQYGPVQEGEAVAPLAVAGIALIAGGGGLAAGAYLSDDVNETALRQTDDTETHYQIYQQAASSADSGKRISEVMDNWMQDGSQIGRMEGQNAYIRALENSSRSLPAKSVVKAEATKATNDWFAERKVRLVRAYEKQIIDYHTMHDVAESEANKSWANSMWSVSSDGSTYSYGIQDGQYYNKTLSLGNGSSITYSDYEIYVGGNSKDNVSPFKETPNTFAASNYGHDLFKTAPAGQSFETIRYIDQSRWYKAWNKTYNAQQEALNEVENFVDATYDQYERGQIDTADLITPSLADRNYSPDGDNGVFTQQAMLRMGYSLPTNFSETKTMNLVADGDEYRGTLLSDGKPTGGFEIGTEYNVSAITGEQIVQTSSGLYTIEENVTIQSVERTDGTTKDSGTVEYPNPDYESANSLDGYRALMQNLSEQQAQINARQQALLNDSGGGGGGLFDFDGLGASLPFGGAGVLATLGAIVVLGLVTRN